MSWRRLRRIAALTALAVAAAACSSTPTTTAPSGLSVTLKPAPATGYRNGEKITVSVGPNKRFTKYLRVEILECADPGGTAAHLPTSALTCDGNTVPGVSVLVAKDGSFSISGYTLYSLPNTTLGETYDNEPVCNRTHACVLYVGLDQEDFTQPKLFSAPFTITPTGGATPTKP